MNRIRVLHTADIHLSKTKDDIYETFSRIISYVKKENIEYLLISGDLFDQNPDPALATRVNDLFSYISLCKIFISPGNHDPYTFNSVYNSGMWADNVHIFKENMSFYTYNNVRIYGRAFKGHFEQKSLLTPVKLDPGYINILVIHGDIDASGSVYNPMALSDLKNLGFDYCALGHVHKQVSSYPYYVYPGTPQGRGFDETGDLGVAVATISKGSYSVKHIPMCKKRYIIRDIDISNISNRDIAEHIRKELSDPLDCYRVILKGNTDYVPDVVEIAALLKPFFDNIEVQDETTLNYNIELLKQENSLRGIFVRMMLEKIKQEPDNRILSDSLYIGLKAFDFDLEEGD